MFEPIEKAVAVGSLCQKPGMGVRTETGNKVKISIVSGKGKEGIKLSAQSVRCRKILRMVAFAHIERAPVYLNATDDLGNKNVRVGVAVAMGIGRQIVGNEIAADLDVRGDGLP